MLAGRYVDTREAEATTLGQALERYAREVTPSKKGAKRGPTGSSDGLPTLSHPSPLPRYAVLTWQLGAMQNSKPGRSPITSGLISPSSRTYTLSPRRNRTSRSRTLAQKSENQVRGRVAMCECRMGKKRQSSPRPRRSTRNSLPGSSWQWKPACGVGNWRACAGSGSQAGWSSCPTLKTEWREAFRFQSARWHCCPRSL